MSLLRPKVTLMSVSTSNTYMKLQNFQKLGKNTEISNKRTLPISEQNLFPQWWPLIRDYPVVLFMDFPQSQHTTMCFCKIFSASLYYMKMTPGGIHFLFHALALR